MIRMSVREQYGVELGQGIERNPRRAHSRKEFAKRGIKIGISKKPLPADLN
jgi:hypothetical protein